jgi:hypothetical protein
MKDFTPLWKTKAHNKSLTRADFFQRALLRSIKAKTFITYQEKESLAINLIQQAFTPVTKQIKLENGHSEYSSVLWAANESNLFSKRIDQSLLSSLETEEEEALYNQLLRNVLTKLNQKTKEQYTYIFIRKDLSREQMIVQSSHVTLLLSTKLNGQIEQPQELNFVLCGAVNESELKSIKDHFSTNNIETVEFIEPDLNNQLTALASYSIAFNQRKFAKGYKILRGEPPKLPQELNQDKPLFGTHIRETVQALKNVFRR